MKLFPKGIPQEGYYISVATNAPTYGLTAYNLCYNNGKNPRLVVQIVANTLSMMEVQRAVPR